MTRKEQKGLCKTSFRFWLQELEIVRLSNPAFYDELAKHVNRYRVWVSEAGSLDDLPEVPGIDDTE